MEGSSHGREGVARLVPSRCCVNLIGAQLSPVCQTRDPELFQAGGNSVVVDGEFEAAFYAAQHPDQLVGIQ